jgi:hypothetical protein
MTIPLPNLAAAAGKKVPVPAPGKFDANQRKNNPQ